MPSQGSHNFLDYAGMLLPGFVVPQEVYTTNVAGFQPLPPVQFYVGGHLGIRLTDAEIQNVQHLAGGASQPHLNDTGGKIAIRIVWPGYQSWYRHIHILKHGQPRVPITKAHLAYEVAKTVRVYLEEKAAVQSTEDRPDWWLSSSPFEKLILLELRHVSPGSWQPVLCRD